MMLKWDRLVLILVMTWGVLSPVEAKTLRVLTTLPDFAEMAKTMGGDLVEVEALLQGSEDAHHLDPKPSFIMKAMKADLIVRNGLELEDAWLKKVVLGTGRSELRFGEKRDCDLGSGVEVLDRPTQPPSRAQGHVHGAGNPHYNLSPRSLVEASLRLQNCLNAVAPEQASRWAEGQKKFASQMEELRGRLRSELDSVLKERKGEGQSLEIFEYHQEFVYWARDYGVKIRGQIEEKPGLPPSAARVIRLGEELKQAKVDLILASSSHPLRHLQAVEKSSGVPFVQVPVMAARDRGIAETQALIIKRFQVLFLRPAESQRK